MTVYLGKKPVGVTKIVKKEVAKTKFGVSIDAFLGNVNADGNYVLAKEGFVVDGTGIKTIYDSGSLTSRFIQTNWTRVHFPDLVAIGNGYAYITFGPCSETFSYALSPNFYSDKIVDLPSLETINGQYAAQDMFSVSHISSINVPKLAVINGTNAANAMFSYNALTQASLPSLTTISGSTAALGMFRNNRIKSVDLSSLTTVSGSGACRSMFQDNKELTRVDFPSLVSVEADCFGKTSSNAIFSGCTGLLEIHFRADAQAMVESLSAYQYKFGATNCTILFDL